MADMKCLVVTPEETAVEETVTFVALPLYDGEIGVSANHAPLIGRMGYGELRLKCTNGDTLVYYVDGGFVQIADNVVYVMTNRAIAAKGLETDAVATSLEEAKSMKANSDETFEARDKAVTQYRAQLRVSKKS